MSAPTAHLSPEAKASLPQHVAIIMDGNGRWAKQRGLPRIEGHRQGAESARRGQLDPADINEQVISQHLWTRNFPDPDVLIRTSGEMRISNFLLWQISYAELVITPILWPDFRKPQFFAALEEYARRHR